MRDLNNLDDIDREQIEKSGQEIDGFKNNNNDFFDYLSGMIKMSMHDCNYGDGDIQSVIDEVREHYERDKASDVLTWEQTHALE